MECDGSGGGGRGSGDGGDRMDYDASHLLHCCGCAVSTMLGPGKMVWGSMSSDVGLTY